MRTLSQPSRWQEEIRKSRFLATAVPLASAEHASSLLSELSVAEASHNCWAWRWGNAYRFSDDGEPGGTAGRPILAAIENQQFDRVLIVVTRWYGGIQLGTGGLARAYGGCAIQALQTGQSEPIIERETVTCFCPYAHLEHFRAQLDEAGALMEQEEFTATGVAMELAVLPQSVPALNQFLLAVTRGDYQLTKKSATP